MQSATQEKKRPTGSKQRRDIINRALTDFLAHGSTTQDDINDLIVFLNARPSFEPVLDYVTDVEARLELVHKIHQCCCLERKARKLDFTASVWSAFMIAPLSVLQEEYLKLMNKNDKQPSLLIGLRTMSGQLPGLFKTFLTRPFSQSDEYSYFGLGKRKRPTAVPSRNQDEASKCLARDGHRCLVTKLPHPQACHIFPFDAIKDPERTEEVLMSISPVWGYRFCQRMYKLLLSKEDGILDTARNMISLSPNLHRMRREGMIAFEPLGPITVDDDDKTPETIHSLAMRLHWLPKSKFSPFQILESFNLNPKDAHLTESKSEFKSEKQSFIRDGQSGRRIRNGSLIEVSAPNPELLPHPDIVALQWDLLRMISLCGAGAMDDDDDGDDDDDTSSSEDGEGLEDVEDIGFPSIEKSSPS